MDTRIDITLKGIYYNDRVPQFKISFDDSLICSGFLKDEVTFHIVGKFKEGSYPIEVELLNKTDDDTIINDNTFLDKAIEITQIKFNDIDCKDCLLHSTYTSNDLKRNLKGQNYISWNGKWRLDISVPIFTYMHQKKKFGWIYNLK